MKSPDTVILMTLPVVVVNYAAILVASIVSIIISFIWFGPIFGRT